LLFPEQVSIILGLGLVAQSVEQRIENPCVGGSIPPRATKKLVLKIRAYSDVSPYFLRLQFYNSKLGSTFISRSQYLITFSGEVDYCYTAAALSLIRILISTQNHPL
jgi:hypothetical protein